jgi:hypothetical protein
MASDPRDLGGAIGSAVGRIAREATQQPPRKRRGLARRTGRALSGMRGVAAGAALVTVAPLVAQGVRRGVREAARWRAS